MKITAALLMVCVSGVFAAEANSQSARVTISMENVKLKTVLDEIERQTDYLFLFSPEDVNTENKVSVHAKEKEVSKVLSSVLKGSDVSYAMEGTSIFLIKGEKRAENSSMQKQTKTISGIVRDEHGEPMIGVNVLEEGTTNGALTNLAGEFSFEIRDDAVLVVSYIGYIQQRIPVAGKTNFDVVLKEHSQALNEVVVTALGIKRQQRSLGYSTTQVGGEDFTMARDPNLGNAFSGKIAGVTVAGNATGTGGSSRVVIRGNASLTGNNQPLYVVDGVPYDNTNQGKAGMWGGMDMGDGLTNINPDDVENIQVLKGAAASALYGYRGGNGAILITTKSGKKGKGVSIEFNNNLTFNTIYDNRDFQKVYGQGMDGKRPMTADAAKSSEMHSWGDRLDGDKAVNFLGNEYNYSYEDNWKHFYRTGVNNSTTLAISGASENISYRFGVSNMYEKSNLPNSNVSQQGISMNTTYDITSKLHLIVSANYVFEKFRGRASLSDGNGNTNASLLYRGNSFDVRWLKRGDDNCAWGTDADGNEMLGGTNVYFNNPYWLQYRKTNETNKNRLTGSMTLRYDITDWLYAQGAIQRDGFNMDFKQIQPRGAAADKGGWINEFSKTYSEMNLNYLIGANKTYGDWEIGATLGGNRLRNIAKQWKVDNGGPFVVDGLWSTNNIEDHKYTKDYKEYQVNSIYGTLDFGWRNQVFLNLTARKDWFSTLSPDNNGYLYPSATLSWVFTDTFGAPSWFTFGKLRASCASASNGTTPYQNLLTYKLQNYVVNGQKLATINNNAYPNAKLKPVRISEYEAGLSLAFLNNRLSFDMAYYVKNTKDDIAVVSVSYATGYRAMVQNVGEVRNNGFEFLLNAVPVHSRNFEWNTNFNFAYNNSEVKYLGQGVNSLSIDGAESRFGNVTVQNIVGKPYGELVGYKYKRHEGEIVYADGVPQREDAVSSLGNGVYKFTGGWNNRFTYKNVTLSFLLDFKTGAKIFSGTNMLLTWNGLHKNTLQGRQQEAGGKITGKGVMKNAAGDFVPNTVEVTAQRYWQSHLDNNLSEAFVYNAGFLKLRELSLGYNFPKSILAKQNVIKGMSISFVARNLWTIIKHTDNIDPESAYNNSNGQGLEFNGYPSTRNLGFNLNVKF